LTPVAHSRPRGSRQIRAFGRTGLLRLSRLGIGRNLLDPFLDRGGSAEPANWQQALSLRRRGWAFLAMAVFSAVLIIGTVTNIVTPKG
jgi:hypothetical protein